MYVYLLLIIIFIKMNIVYLENYREHVMQIY
jgi:hypothetical protein